VLGQLSGEEEANSGLDLPGGQGVLLVVTNKLAGLGGDLVEQVVDEGVHHGHAAGGDAGVGVNLLQHLVDVGGVRLLAGLALLLALRLGLGDSLGRLGGGLGGGSNLGGHFAFVALGGAADALKYCAQQSKQSVGCRTWFVGRSHTVPRKDCIGNDTFRGSFADFVSVITASFLL
jgi:hypothetical protein